MGGRQVAARLRARLRDHAARTSNRSDDEDDDRRAAALAPGGRGGGTRHGRLLRRRQAGPRERAGARPARPAWRSATITSCRRSTCSPRRRRRARTHIDRAGLERNARLLESVLEDFHVRGDIVEVRPGPVVTMYELEPASGIKASRVIQLADDIARNMSALSARVATIPGRSVIGIELPNQKRETVSLSRADRQPGVRGPEHVAAADPGEEYLGRPGHRRHRADAALARRRHHRLGQVGRPQLHDPVAALPDEPGRVPDDHDRSRRCSSSASTTTSRTCSRRS